MMDIDIISKDKYMIVSFQSTSIDINKAKIIEIIVSNLPVSSDRLSLDLKGIKSININGFKYLQSMIKNLNDIKIINLQKKHKKLVS